MAGRKVTSGISLDAFLEGEGDASPAPERAPGPGVHLVSVDVVDEVSKAVMGAIAPFVGKANPMEVIHGIQHAQLVWQVGVLRQAGKL